MCIELKSLGLFLYLIVSCACVFSIDQSCMLLDSVLKLRSLLCNGAWFSLLGLFLSESKLSEHLKYVKHTHI